MVLSKEEMQQALNAIHEEAGKLLSKVDDVEYVAKKPECIASLARYGFDNRAPAEKDE